MEQSKFPEGMTCELTRTSGCGFVIFGASGDLAQRKLFPSLYLLYEKKTVPDEFFILGFSRTRMNDESFREKIRINIPEMNDEDFFSRIYYISGDYESDESYLSLYEKLSELDVRYKTGNNFIFNLALPPALYGTVAEKLVSDGLLKPDHDDKPFHRLMIEKPFGRDYESAVALNSRLLKFINDDQIFRTDHYLGKDTVQNILIFRFANSIFEPVWNASCIDCVQITVSEELGVENRAGYFDQTGLIRDMLQNHMLQLLSLVAMEAPASLEAESVRNEKQKVFESIRSFNLDNLDESFLRAQYADGKHVAYRKEPGVDPESCAETYFAVKMFIDNNRWKGVPFYLKAGKRLDKKETAISVVFKENTHGIFNSFSGWQENKSNVLTFKIQPEQGVTLRFHAKVPGFKHCLAPLNLTFNYIDLFESENAGDYASVILDCILGDQMLFWRKDGIEATWKLLTPVLKHWETCGDDKGKLMHHYPAGSGGPEEAKVFIRKDGFEWME